MVFGTTLKELRQQKGLTQTALADASGVPLGTIRDYEQDKREPLLSNARKLAAALGVSLDKLAGPGPSSKQPGGRARKGK
jgi:transcriptional regulator with XRE-family HTH domain